MPRSGGSFETRLKSPSPDSSQASSFSSCHWLWATCMEQLKQTATPQPLHQSPFTKAGLPRCGLAAQLLWQLFTQQRAGAEVGKMKFSINAQNSLCTALNEPQMLNNIPMLAEGFVAQSPQMGLMIASRLCSLWLELELGCPGLMLNQFTFATWVPMYPILHQASRRTPGLFAWDSPRCQVLSFKLPPVGCSTVDSPYVGAVESSATTYTKCNITIL